MDALKFEHLIKMDEKWVTRIESIHLTLALISLIWKHLLFGHLSKTLFGQSLIIYFFSRILPYYNLV